MTIKNKIIQVIKHLGEPNGISTLDENGKVFKNQLPDEIGSQLVTINKYIDLKEDTDEVKIGIEEFNSKKDILKVHLNGDLLSKDYNYKIIDDGLHIKNLSKIIKWEKGDIFDIEIYKNVSTEKPNKIDISLLEDGSITENKLDSNFIEKLNSKSSSYLLLNKDTMNMAVVLEKIALKNIKTNKNVYIESFFNIKNIIYTNCEHNDQLHRMQINDDNYIEAMCFCYE